MNVTVQIDSAMLNNTLYLYENNWCVLVDPANPIQCKTILKKNAWTPLGVLLTHSHYDHIRGLESLLSQYPSLSIYIHPAEIEALFYPEENFSTMTGTPFSIPLESTIVPLYDDQDLTISSPDKKTHFHFHVHFVPGHSPGSTLYEFSKRGENPKTFLATGDFLFAGTVGRTDLPKGSISQMQSSLASFRKWYPLPTEKTLIIPGHASSPTTSTTTLANEWKHNPFLRSSPR